MITCTTIIVVGHVGNDACFYALTLVYLNENKTTKIMYTWLCPNVHIHKHIIRSKKGYIYIVSGHINIPIYMAIFI